MAAADAKGDPETWVVEISNNILSRIKGDAKLAQADPQQVRKFVDEMVMPVVDFVRMARSGVRQRQSSAPNCRAFSALSSPTSTPGLLRP